MFDWKLKLLDSASPAILDMISGPLIRKKKAPVSLATALAIRVLPIKHTHKICLSLSDCVAASRATPKPLFQPFHRENVKFSKPLTTFDRCAKTGCYGAISTATIISLKCEFHVNDLTLVLTAQSVSEVDFPMTSAEGQPRLEFNF